MSNEAIEEFPEGIQTEIGENGIKISSGDKMKICLARALYADTDIYLIDNILVGLPKSEATKIYNKCIKDYLKDKLRVIVTN